MINVDMKVEFIEQVVKRVPMSMSTIYRYESEGKFPPRIKFGDKSGAYLAHEIDYFILACSRGYDLAQVVKVLLKIREKALRKKSLFQ